MSEEMSIASMANLEEPEAPQGPETKEEPQQEPDGEGKTAAKEKRPETQESDNKGEGEEKSKRLFKKTLKVNGKEKEIELDLDDEEALTRYLQKGLAADERFETAKETEKRLKELEETLKQADPKELLKKRGMDPQEWAEQVLLEMLEESEMTDEQKELRALKKEKEEQEKRVAPVKKQVTDYLKSQGFSDDDMKGKDLDELKAMASEAYQLEVKIQQDLDKEISEAWKNSGLPMKKNFALAIGQEMYGAAMRGEDLSAQEAAEIVKSQWYDNVVSTLNDLDADAIREVLGKDILEKLRKADIKRVSEKTSQSINRQANRPGKPASGLHKKTTSDKDWEALKSKLMAEA